MPDKPQDPSQDSIQQHEHHSESLEGQEGYGVEYEDGRYRSGDLQEAPETGRSGSFETGNQSAYGGAAGQPQVPSDPEAQQGQGGQ